MGRFAVRARTFGELIESAQTAARIFHGYNCFPAWRGWVCEEQLEEAKKYVWAKMGLQGNEAPGDLAIPEDVELGAVRILLSENPLTAERYLEQEAAA